MFSSLNRRHFQWRVALFPWAGRQSSAVVGLAMLASAVKAGEEALPRKGEGVFP
jgi:hypothetical protein